MSRVTLSRYLSVQQRTGHVDDALRRLLESVADACKGIGHAVAQGALGDTLGLAGTSNTHGEEQKKLDLIANEIMIKGTEWCGSLAGMASEEMDDILPISQHYQHGNYLLLFDPLDGSSNVEVNVTIGAIFSVLRAPGNKDAVVQDYLQPGSKQVAAGYVVYGPQTILVMTLGAGVHAFMLDHGIGSWILIHEHLTIPADTREFAINMSNQRHWEEPVQRYVGELLAGTTGPRGKDFNMRWVASMVADVHRIMSRGGIFMYPRDAREPGKPGKLRLLYEANPMSFLVEQAGGAATNGRQRILDLQPTQLHERVAVFLGSKNEVERATSYHA